MNRRTFFAAMLAPAVRPATATPQDSAYTVRGAPICPACAGIAMYTTPFFEARVNIPVPVACGCGWVGTHLRIRG